MANLDNGTSKLKRMPSLAEWGLVSDEGVSSLATVIAERTGAVASTAAAAPHSISKDTGAERVAPALPPVAQAVKRMPSLGAWAMYEHVDAAGTGEERDPSGAGAFGDSEETNSGSEVERSQNVLGRVADPPVSETVGNDTGVKRKGVVRGGTETVPKPPPKRMKSATETSSAPTRRSKRIGVPQK
jgi:hypothetical protein